MFHPSGVTIKFAGMGVNVKDLFDEDFLKRLEHLRLVSRKMRTGKNSGERRSPLKGQSVEFADFRNYSSGDDFRYIDWNSYARTEKLFVKLFMEEQDLLLNIFIDVSKSMSWGEPPKERLALQLAAAFSYLALAAYDRVAIAACSEQLAAYQAPLRGKTGIDQAWTFLAQLSFAGSTNLNQALLEYGRFSRGPGVALLISDLLSPHGFQDGVKFLQYLRQEVIVLQLLAPEEINPTLHGDWRLLDSESGESREISASPRLLKAYRKKLDDFTEANRDFCFRRGIGFLQVSSATPFEELLLQLLPRAGILA
ncbi:conserved hypothetical protein [Syntrophomonas wolfei subsp. wolfei str. Goettingen G311]|uniref:DUF58 domain-containing protein n=1 Tax=Syntrophomonas wolfei subsp. wolfei (strain DSM 2245B / Goettingen) TaxID=335541 RepID=Q0AW88_SYNWW|nr:conserved hypothetical protein [Syntrophomonas wolfei subsp. wolfei str. Goettingen G311]